MFVLKILVIFMSKLPFNLEFEHFEQKNLEGLMCRGIRPVETMGTKIGLDRLDGSYNAITLSASSLFSSASFLSVV